MSNVLIGIIGVVLFIGLALAGALFLGPRFQNATQNSKASQVIQQTYQVAHALNLKILEDAKRPAASTAADDLVSRRFLKSFPKGPYGTQVFTVDSTFSNGGPVVYAAMSMGSSADALKTCQAIEALYHFNADGSVPSTADPNIGEPQAGCLKDNIFGLGYVAYVKV